MEMNFNAFQNVLSVYLKACCFNSFIIQYWEKKRKKRKEDEKTTTTKNKQKPNRIMHVFRHQH
jgi:hypothetical protein